MGEDGSQLLVWSLLADSLDPALASVGRLAAAFSDTPGKLKMR